MTTNPITFYRDAQRSWSKLSRSKRQMIGLAAVCIGIFAIIVQGTRPMIDEAAYIPLLNTIAKGESNGSYNAYFGRVGNADIRFTDMTIAEVMSWQKDYVEKGNASNAVGRYQFMGTTLAGLVKQLHLSPDLKFNEALQDRLAIALMERRGSLAFAQGRITREQFATNLSMEWAALPRVTGENPQESYYAGDGLNYARISIDEILDAIDKLQTNK